MGVFVFVAIGEEADRAREHEPSGDDDRKGDRVAEHGDRDDGTGERRRGEEGSFPSRAHEPEWVGVQQRIERGGHAVPEDKIRARYARLWSHVARAIALVPAAFVALRISAGCDGGE